MASENVSILKHRGVPWPDEYGQIPASRVCREGLSRYWLVAMQRLGALLATA